MELPDELLVGRAQENDPDAFRELVDKYKAKIYYIACRVMGNHSDADDVAQETFIRVYRGLKKFKGHSRLYTWLYRILINCCMDSLRKRKRRGGDLRLDEAAQLEERAVGSGVTTGPAEAVHPAELNELQRAVADALESLSLKHRMTLVLHEFDGMAHQDIAQVMGCSIGTARSRLHYARMKMQQKLRKFVE
jgi:RNA polymerase sigma-70 factor, ECF subfamily